MTTRDLVLTALFAAIIVALGLLPPIFLGFIPVPITAQSLGVMCAGVILGANRGAVSVLLVLLLAAIGLPVLSGGRGGLAVFVAPTSGFLYGWVAAAYVTGAIAERVAVNIRQPSLQFVAFTFAAIFGGVFVLYVSGISYLVAITGLPFAKAFWGSLAFVPGDLVKAVVAGAAGRAVMAGYPVLAPRKI